MLTTLQSTLKFLKSRNRFDMLDKISREWRFLNSELVEEKYLVDLFPEVGNMSVEATVDIRHHFELPYGERTVLSAIAQVAQPSVVFEFGTYTGSTTVMLAKACGGGTELHTLDLPDDLLISAGIHPDTVGHVIRESAEVDKHRIVQHRENSRKFDYSFLEGKVDLVFVDGSHEYDDVISDSQNAMRMLSPGGVVVWDDYHTPCLPVAAAIDDLAKDYAIYRVASTRLAVFRR